MMIKSYWSFLIALRGGWTFRYHILIYLLYLVASCDAVVGNCTSGHFTNKLGTQMVCCSYICENLPTSIYNAARCCKEIACSPSYPNVCKQVIPPLSHIIVQSKHPIAVTPTVTSQIANANSDNCTTGYFINSHSDRKQVCCSNICENITKTSKYNFNQCCKKTECKRYYPSTCNQIGLQLSQKPVPIYHTSRPATETNKPFVIVTFPLPQKPTNRADVLLRYNFNATTNVTMTRSDTPSTNNTEPQDDEKRNWMVYVQVIGYSVLVCLGFFAGFLYFVYRFKGKSRKGYRNTNRANHFVKGNRISAVSRTDSCKTPYTEVSEASDEKKLLKFPRNFPKISIEIDIERHMNEDIILLPNWTVLREIMVEDIIIQEKLGNGNFGEVFKGMLCNNLYHSSEVAIKTTPNCSNQNTTDYNVYCLQLELQILRLLGEHINIVTLIGAIMKPNRIGDFVIVTEYCPLRDLRSYIEKLRPSVDLLNFHKPLIDELNSILENGNLCLSSLLMYALQIANGAHFFSHCRKVIHRDLSLRNIMLTNEHIVKIGDFGLAVNDSAYEVQTRMMLPTRWLAPESLKGNKSEFTTKSDVWSFGVLLWELFTLAEDPLKVAAPKGPELFRQWLEEGYRFQVNSAFMPPLVSDMINQCWNMEPVKRPNFFECRSFIQNILSNHSFKVFEYIAPKISFDSEIQ